MDNNPYWHVLNFYPDGVVNPNRLKKIRQVRKSDYFGVQPCEETGRFVAECYVGNGQHRDLGVFDTEEEAALAHDRVAANRWGPKYMNFPDKYPGPLPQTDGSSSDSSDETARVGAARRGGKDGTPAKRGRVTGRSSSHGRRSAAQDAKRRQPSNSTLRRSGRTSSTRLSPSSTHPASTPPQDGTASAAGGVGSRRGDRQSPKAETPDVASSTSQNSSSGGSSSTPITIKTMDHDISTDNSTAGSSTLLTDTSSLAQPFVSQPTAATQSLDCSAASRCAETSALSARAASQPPQSSPPQTSNGTVTEQLQSNGGTFSAAAPSSSNAQGDVFMQLRKWVAKAWADARMSKDPEATRYAKATSALYKARESLRAKVLVFVEELALDLARSDEQKLLVDMFVEAYGEGAFEE